MLLVHNMVMKANVHEVKARLSSYLARVEAGETVILCRRNVPIAEIRPVSRQPTGPRPLGLGRVEYGDWSLPDEFFDPLPDDLLDGFEGRGR